MNNVATLYFVITYGLTFFSGSISIRHVAHANSEQPG